MAPFLKDSELESVERKSYRARTKKERASCSSSGMPESGMSGVLKWSLVPFSDGFRDADIVKEPNDKEEWWKVDQTAREEVESRSKGKEERCEVV